ncbi:thioredoxin family protein [Patescibacteria group bacterium]|nr:thioredoxin family protein [Patescibacteria group bacterium]MBU1868164.1 thioredoxin family protein [Patescibacteria group bacterium]
MKIQVLGSGCLNCKKLYELTQEAIKQISLDYEVEYLTGQDGIQKMIDLGVMSSPVLVIDDKPVMTGFINDVEKIKNAIQATKGKP